KDGSIVWVNLTRVRLGDADDPRPQHLSLIEDITERKRAEQALLESEERYRELFENARDPIYVHDLSGKYTSVNRAAERLSKYPREEILGRDFAEFIAPAHLKMIRAHLCKKLNEEGETTHEIEVITKEGEAVPVEVSSRLIYENGVPVSVQGTARDITDRKRAQEAFRQFSHQLIEAQECERQRIARELHDEIGQVLTAVRLNLQAVQTACQSATCQPYIDENISVVDEALRKVRDLAFDLRPALLDDLGLIAALRWYVDRFAKRSGIRATVRANPLASEHRLPRAVETTAFRIAQEALTNVARHAQAESVVVELQYESEEVTLRIVDDGIGFNKQPFSLSGADLGLRGMEERAVAVKGTLEIVPVTPTGTEVRVRLPLSVHLR
ncbi:MAG TPA: PAS domain S-box protein, partial [Pyrinomonadaceae bacterium]|nr:PAS domain S-box protein [Pyrinomonadaceae bacterium]